MEKIIALPEEADEARTRLPLVPVAFGSGGKFPSAAEAHLLLSVRAGSLSYTDSAGEETVDEGQLLFVRRGQTLSGLELSADFDCEFALFDAAEDFLSHLELDDISVGEVGEGCGLSAVAKMSIYALEYYHDCLKICAEVYAALAKIARDRMISKLERFDTLSERLSPAILQIE